MKSSNPSGLFSPERLLDHSMPFHLLQNILTYYLDLPCFLISPGNFKAWNTVVTARQKKSSPIDYENALQWQERIRYNERILRAVVQGRKALCQPHLGLHGLFVPVMKGGACVGVLQAGAFLRDVPGEADLLGLWKVLRGRAPKAGEEAFFEYARSLVDTPILDEALLEALRELLELFGAFLTRSLGGHEAGERMRALQKTVFAKRLWHRQWVDWQVIQPTFFRFNGDAKTLMPWEVDELGITRFPSIVLAAKREGTGKEWTDWLEARSFQREALRIAPELSETLAYPLGNYGALLLTSAKERQTPERAAVEIRARAALFAWRMSEKLGCKVWVGMGHVDPTGTGLQESYHEAVAALQVAVARNEDIVRYQDLSKAEFGETKLRHKIAALAEALLEQGRDPSAPHSGVFIQDILVETRGRPETTRRIFMETLHRLLAALESRKRIDDADLAELESGITLNMETAIGLNEMVGRFEAALGLLLSFLERPLSGEKYFRLRKACEAISASLQETWTLSFAARQFGFSNTGFSREFARHAGMSFSDFLLSQRLDKAKRLLNDRLPLGQVAEACGFRSVNYFNQIFKRKVGLPPGKFRSQKGA